MPVFIVAEIGVNHDGSIERAKMLVRNAHLAGADAVKFQLWSANRFPKIENLRLSPSQLNEAISIAEALRIPWFCTPFDLESVSILYDLGMKRWKIPSGFLKDEAYLNAIADSGPTKVILSTGKGNLDKEPTIKEINHCIAKFLDGSEVTILYCVSKYPALPKDFFLPSIAGLRTIFPLCEIGFSDHSNLIELSLGAVALGATTIERHITYDHLANGPDHRSSLMPDQFYTMVRQIRNIEKASGMR